MNISGYPAQMQGHSLPLQGLGPSPGCCVNNGLLLIHDCGIALQRYINIVYCCNSFKNYVNCFYNR